jgi:hypothetical protein
MGPGDTTFTRTPLLGPFRVPLRQRSSTLRAVRSSPCPQKPPCSKARGASPLSLVQADPRGVAHQYREHAPEARGQHV